jgi:hypothetical protein
MRIQNFNMDTRSPLLKHKFDEIDIKEFFPGAFAYHWHSIFWLSGEPAPNSFAYSLLGHFKQNGMLPAPVSKKISRVVDLPIKDSFAMCGGTPFQKEAFDAMDSTLKRSCGGSAKLTRNGIGTFQDHNTSQCLAALKGMPQPTLVSNDCSKRGTILFHTLFTASAEYEFGPPNELFVYSFACTQNQCSRLVVWFLREADLQAALKIIDLSRLKLPVDFRMLPAYGELVKGTPLEGHSMPVFEKVQVVTEKWQLAAISDVVTNARASCSQLALMRSFVRA